MPCSSEYLLPTEREAESARIIELLKEVRGEPFNHKSPSDIYGAVSMLDFHTDALCAWCKGNDVSSKSLELQIWWRDHQMADRAREKREADERSEHAALARARDKLTPALESLTSDERDALFTWGLSRKGGT